VRPEPPSAPGVSDLLKRALAGRLREVGEALGAGRLEAAAADAGGPGPAPRTARGPAPSAERQATERDAEESLRRLMVSALPRLRDLSVGDADRALVFSLLTDLEAPARSEDLRFLDAWNNVCEILLAWPRDQLNRDDACGALRAYASLLETHIRRLEGRP
jgi:hypothetical protein